MINEYALDPALLTTWDTVRFFLDKFGIDQGRLLAQYPGDRLWAARVLAQFPNESGPAQSARKRVEVRLESIVKTAAVFAARRRQVHWNEAMPWAINAEQEHSNNPFYAIVTRENPGKRTHVIVGDDIDEHNPPVLWRVHRSRVIARQGAAMADALTPLFRLARTVVFVDRNFDPLDRGYQIALASFLQCIWDCCRERSNVRVEYHIGNDNRRHEPNQRKLHTAAEFVRLCSANLASLIPLGMRVRFVRWHYGELHDRYAITDRATVKFGHGLDEAGPNEINQTVELTLLDRAASARHYDAFLGQPPCYTPDPGSTVEVVGAKPA